MSDETNLTEAYEAVDAAEKAMVAETERLMNEFKASLEALTAGLPAAGSSNPARQLVVQVLASINGVAGYQLTTVKNLYGLNPPITTPAI